MTKLVRINAFIKLYLHRVIFEKVYSFSKITCYLIHSDYDPVLDYK